MITRFNYNYSFVDLLKALLSLCRKEASLPMIFVELFPKSQIYPVESAHLAIKYALKSFKLKKGSKIGVQPYTCSSVFSAIKSAGLVPYFVDINQNLTLDTNDLSKKISQIDALIVTHIFGFPADITAIKKIALSIPIIEDCAHALFSQYQQQSVGTFFDVAVFSFGNGKFPSLGGGGLLVVNNPKWNNCVPFLSSLPKPNIANEIAHIVKSYLSSLMHTKQVQKLLYTVLSDNYFNNRNREPIKNSIFEQQMHRSTKYLLAHKLPFYKKNSLKQQENGQHLSQNLTGYYPQLDPMGNKVNYFFVVILEKKRDALHHYLKKNQLITGKHFQYAMHWVLAFGYRLGDCPTFENQIHQVLAIPCHHNLNQTELDDITGHLLEFKKTNA